ncbi:hypothetical protein WJX77_000568 [Trebouxia sp. C0004]
MSAFSIAACDATLSKSTSSTKQDTEDQLRQLQHQLKLQHLYQDATHVIVQRSFQMEIDLDQTAVLLCQEMQAGAHRDVSICQLEACFAWEQEHRILAMAAIATLTAQLRLKDQELLAQADEHNNTKAQLECANLLLANMGTKAPETNQQGKAVVTAVLADMRLAVRHQLSAV